MPFSLVVPDLLPLPDTALDPPALPMLDRLLAWAQAPDIATHWRAGVAQDLGLADLATLPCAQVAAWALAAPPAPGSGVALATPVHCIAGISRVNLHPAGVLQLDTGEAHALSESFAATLGSEALQLAPLQGGFLLHGTLLGKPGGPDDGDPALLQGSTLVPHVPGNADPQLQRLGAEIQMWLHDHAINRQRARRGQLPITALWLWGTGSAATPVRARATLPVALAEDPWVSGLWSAADGTVRPAVAGYDSVDAQDALAVTTVADVLIRNASLQSLETQWFQPLFEALDSRRLPSFSLRLGTHRWHVHHRRWTRYWRRTVPWWQRLAA